MASSSGDPDGLHKMIHIQPTLGTLHDLETLISQLKDFAEAPPSSNEGDRGRKANQCVKLCWELRYIRSIFSKVDNFGSNVGVSLSRLEKKVRSTAEEIRGAHEDGTLTPDQVQGKLLSIASSIADLKVLLPSVPDAASKPTRIAKGNAAAKELTFHNELPSLYSGRNYEIDPIFEELFEGLYNRAQRLLLFFSVFPAGCVVDRRVLKNWWHGEGLLGLSFDQGEDTAEAILEELMARCLVEAVRKNYRLVGFKMDPFVHFAVVMNAVKSGFFFFDPSGNPNLSLGKSSGGCLVRSKGVVSSLNKLEKVKDAAVLEGLETVFNINEQFPDFKLEFFLKLKNLKVLSLGQWESGLGRHIELENTEFLKGLKGMKGLMLLSLQGMSQVFELPDAVCRLRNLKILNLKACYNLNALPQGIGSLKKLMLLDISECYLLDLMPEGMASLTELQILKGFLIPDQYQGRCCLFPDLARLQNLIKLSVNAERAEFPGNSLATLEKLRKLKRLSISWGFLRKEKINAPTEASTALKEEKKAERESEKSQSTIPTIHEVEDEDEDEVAAAAEKISRVGTDRTMTVDAVGGNESTGSSKQPIYSAEIIEESHSASQGARVGDKQPVDATSQPKGTDDKASGGHGMNQEGRTPRLLKRTASNIAQKLKKSTPQAIDPDLEVVQFESLEKLDLECYPHAAAPVWLKPQNMKKLKKLYIRGGKLRKLEKVQADDCWEVEILRLKFLEKLDMRWDELLDLFPKLAYLEMEGIKTLTGCPSDPNGVWLRRTSGNDTRLLMVKDEPKEFQERVARESRMPTVDN